MAIGCRTLAHRRDGRPGPVGSGRRMAVANTGSGRVRFVARGRQNLGAAALAVRCSALADLDYEFLYDRARHLLSIGYNVGEHRLDASFYDLLASEARLASFVAIAQGKLPQEHWFASAAC